MNESAQSAEPWYRDELLGLFYPALGLVRYNFDWRKYGHIDRPIANDRLLIDEYGTIHHEIYHYLQTVSTTYCYYLFLLECSKAAAYENLIHFFRASSPKVSFCVPFWAWLNLPEVARATSARARKFRDTRFQHANSANVLQELLHKGVRLSQLRSGLLQEVTSFARGGINLLANWSPHLSCDRGRCFDFGVEIGPHINPVDDAGVQISGEMLLENAAFIISTYPLWHEESRNSTSIVLELTQHFGTTFYTRLIEFAARTLEIRKATVFKNTFLALCDLALNIPIQFAGSARSHPINWIDLHPGWRFVRALSAARSLKPIRRYDADYGRFVGALCRQLGWSTPSAIWREFTASHTGRPSSVWLDEECSRVASQKTQCPWRFFDPGDDLFTASDWIADNFPPMVEDSARHNVILTRKNELGYRTINWYFDTKIPQQLMLGSSVEFRLPGISDAVMRDTVSAKLKQFHLTMDGIQALSSKKAARGYGHYAKRKKHYRRLLLPSEYPIFFRS